MPADILQNNLHDSDIRGGHVDLYEVEKSDTIPYSYCLRKQLSIDVKYHGYSFAMKLHPDIITMPLHSDKLRGKRVHKKQKDVMSVTYHEYEITCNNEQCNIQVLRLRNRVIANNEIAWGPFFAFLFATKFPKPMVCIEDVISYRDPLYTHLDINATLVDDQLMLSDVRGMIDLFKHHALRANPNIVGLYSKYTTDIDAIKKTAKDAYLNIVHDCDRYCAVSTIGVISEVPFTTIEYDGMRCVKALKELPYSETYKSSRNSHLVKSKGSPYAHDSVYIIPQIDKMYYAMHGNTTQHSNNTLSSTVVIVSACVLPALIVGSTVTYIAQSSSKFAQSIRNKIAAMTHTTGGMQRVNTEDRNDNVHNEIQDT